MIIRFYILLLGLFLAGGAGMWRINQSSTPPVRKANTLKFFSYFLIINLVFWSILAGEEILMAVLGLIIVLSARELWILPSGKILFKSGLVLLFLLCSLSLFSLYTLNTELLLTGFFIVTVFDAFSQISGQLFGKRKLIPSISPGKTRAGFAGGLLSAIAVGLYAGYLLDMNPVAALILGIGTALGAFAGDLGASFVKRTFGIKDFSRLLPGQGGMLDRFDSLFGASVFLHGFNQFLF